MRYMNTKWGKGTLIPSHQLLVSHFILLKCGKTTSWFCTQQVCHGEEVCESQMIFLFLPEHHFYAKLFKETCRKIEPAFTDRNLNWNFVLQWQTLLLGKKHFFHDKTNSTAKNTLNGIKIEFLGPLLLNTIK